jgi:4'-phosphopantetheinyl transferase
MKANTVKISFLHKKQPAVCVLSLVSSDNYSKLNCKRYLSKEEILKAGTFTSEKARLHFVLGRIATKKALKVLDDIRPQQAGASNEINIKNTDNGNPVIENSEYCASISHSQNTAVSLVFRSEFSFGVDIDYIRENRTNALKYINREDEPIQNNISELTVAWTMKEALAKALKCGFNCPFEELEISEFIKKNHTFECQFAKHKNFVGTAILHKNKSLAIAYRKEYEISLDNMDYMILV